MKRISFGQLCPRWACLGLIVLAVAGCQPEKPEPWETFADLNQAPYKAQAGSGNAWDQYLLAANLADKATEKFKDQADLRGNQQTEYLSRIDTALSMAIRAGGMNCTPQFVAQDPFLPRRSHSGLSAIGRGLELKIQTLDEEGAADGSAQYIVAAHRMANHLSGGDAQDALLGYWIASEARRSSVALIQRMSAGALTNLGNSILASLDKAPPLSTTLDNELKSMLAGVQFISDVHQKKEYGLLETALYKQADPAIDFLKKLKEKDRVEYFRGFSQEAKNRIEHARQTADIPVIERKAFQIDQGADRPWKRFATHLFTPLDTFLIERDLHIARSRLFALTCLALAGGKAQGSAPLVFKNLPANADTDPYSGKPFPYRVANREFRIYSVGIDGRDDGGDSNSENREPDLLLEPARK
ncbi:MAG: hypothetical protein KF836_05755 [Fimbriimonadaceae bacterium]|nr:hypothetical protein [Fimbriimonadaceae bacterium]